MEILGSETLIKDFEEALPTQPKGHGGGAITSNSGCPIRIKKHYCTCVNQPA